MFVAGAAELRCPWFLSKRRRNPAAAAAGQRIIVFAMWEISLQGFVMDRYVASRALIISK